MVQKVQLVAPDGGWGWVVMTAYALNNLVLIPVLQSFGLIFTEAFKKLDLSATEGSMILTSNASIFMFMAFINGPLLKRYSFRKTAFVGSIMITGGIMLTSQSNKFYQIIVTYGLITSLGSVIGMASFSMALNTYFVKNRKKVLSFTFTITSIGTIFAPQLVSYLMSVYSVHGTILIVGAIVSHTLIASLLLQPVKWHMKRETPNKSSFKDNIDSEIDLIHQYTLDETDSRTHFQDASSSKPTDDEERDILIRPESRVISLVYNPHMSVKIVQEKKFLRRSFDSLVDFFDLTLLKDLTYVNIVIGESIVVLAETNFTLLIPFILADMGFDILKITTFMSVLSAADLLLRFLSPLVGDHFKKTPRLVYLISLVMLTIGRTFLVVFSSYGWLLFGAAFLGMIKEVKTVYATLVLPGYVQQDRLAAASGLQMMINGLLMFVGSPFFGLLRDKTGSYRESIIIMNILTVVTIVMWSVELIYSKLKSKHRNVGLVENG